VPQSSLPEAIREEIGRLGKADIMVGIPSFKNAATIGYVVRAAHAGLVQFFPDSRPVLVNSDAGSPDGTQRVVIETEPPDYVQEILLVRPRNRLQRVTLTYPEVDGIAGKGAALHAIFEMARALKVQALVVVDSDLRSIGPEWIELLAGPILKGGFDFVAPLYARYKWDGTITNTVTYPLTRALYGHRIRQPIGGDFGVSGDLVAHYLEQDDWSADVSRFGIDIWMTTKALAGGFAVCQARLGAKVHDPKDPGADLGPMFRQVVGTLLRLAVEHADAWIDVKGSHDTPIYGFERIIDPPPLRIDVVRLLTEFGNGAAAFGSAWTEILEPRTAEVVMELADDAGRAASAIRPGSEWTDDPRLASAPPPFHFPDHAWARVLYDAIVATRAGEIPPERLVSALLPLYFGKVAGLLLETRTADADQAEETVGRLARELELSKPYLLRAWEGEAVAPAVVASA
jgi:hypothetical protein